MPKVKVDQTGFQFDPKDKAFDTGNMLLNGLVKAAIGYANSSDLNHDGKADITQYMPFVIKAMPVIAALLPLIKAPRFVQWFLEQNFVVDKSAAKVQLVKLVAIADEVAEVKIACNPEPLPEVPEVV